MTLVAKKFLPEISGLSQRFNCTLIRASYKKRFINQKQVVIAATDDRVLNRQVYVDAKAVNVLVNVADTPELCDFYMGGIVTRGNVKIAISTNGKSPTLAKRLRQFFEDLLQENIDDLAISLNEYRHTIKADFQEKVRALNRLTKNLLN